MANAVEEMLPIRRVVVTDVDISFSSMVMLMIKFVLATIPAAIILVFIAVVVAAIVGRL